MDHHYSGGSAWSASVKGGPPAGSRGRAAGGGQGVKPPEVESFLYNLYKVAKRYQGFK